MQKTWDKPRFQFDFKQKAFAIIRLLLLFQKSQFSHNSFSKSFYFSQKLCFYLLFKKIHLMYLKKSNNFHYMLFDSDDSIFFHKFNNNYYGGSKLYTLCEFDKLKQFVKIQ